jgi:hypothetical protein
MPSERNTQPTRTGVVFRVAISSAQGQEPPTAQTEKPKDAHADCPVHKAREQSSGSAMNERGAKGMGFSPTATIPITSCWGSSFLGHPEAKFFERKQKRGHFQFGKEGDISILV